MDVKMKGSESGEVKSSPASVFKEIKKSCIDCHTTRTPLWRGGPAGPRSLCNACGIRYRKTKRALSGRDPTLQESLEEEEEAAILLMSLSYDYIYA